MMDARKYNCWIVIRDREYLMARDKERDMYIFSPYKFDAAPLTQGQAQSIARKICGYSKRFNHVTGAYVE